MAKENPAHEAKAGEPHFADEGEKSAAQKDGSVQTDGVRARRALMLKHFLPNADWINTHIVSKGKGTRGVIGRIYGIATSADKKNNTMPDGKVTESIVVAGIFNGESYVTGEISEASTVYFPMAYAEKIEALFKSQPDIKAIEVDCDVGIEATGKTIPYEWVIVAYREGEEMAVMKRLKGSRERPKQLLLTAGTK